MDACDMIRVIGGSPIGENRKPKPEPPGTNDTFHETVAAEVLAT